MLATTSWIIIAALAVACHAQITTTLYWPSNTSDAQGQTAFNEGDTLIVMWNAMQGGPDDLWIAASNGQYHNRIASNQIIAEDGSINYKIAMGNEAINANTDGSWGLYFIPTGAPFDKSAEPTYNAGPRFQLFKAGDSIPSSQGLPTSTITSTTTSPTATPAASSPTASSQPASDSSPGLSSGVLTGIAIGGVVGLCAMLGLLFWALRLRRKVKAANNHRSSGIIPPSGIMPEKNEPRSPGIRTVSGLHEAHGDRHQPIEMEAKRKSMYHVHEMAG
jgi:hypothetical protein